MPRTREHVLRKDFKGKIPHVSGVRMLRDYPSFPELGVKVTNFPLTNFDMTINEVCGECNSGWMNDLESEVEDIVVALANGQFRDLTGPEVEALRFWMVKTALVKTLQNRESGRLTRLLDEMYRLKKAPKYVAVQFGVCSGPAPNPVGRHIWMTLLPPEDQKVEKGRVKAGHHRLDLVVFGVGRLFFAVTLPTTKKISGFGYICTRVMRQHGAGWNVLQEGSKHPLRLKRIYMDPEVAYINGSVLRQIHDGQTDVHDTGWEAPRPPVSIGCVYPLTEEEVEISDRGGDISYDDPERWIMWNLNEPSPFGPEYDELAETLRQESSIEGPAARRARRQRERRGA